MVTPPLLSSARRSERVMLDALVSLRRSGQLNYRVRVFNASLHGCLIEFIERPEVDELLWVKFEGMQAIEAEVCWIDGFIAGVNFAAPIHPAVFDQLIARLSRPAR